MYLLCTGTNLLAPTWNPSHACLRPPFFFFVFLSSFSWLLSSLDRQKEALVSMFRMYTRYLTFIPSRSDVRQGQGVRAANA